MFKKLCCRVNPWLGCHRCGWSLCETCRRNWPLRPNRSIHNEQSPECTEALDVNTNYYDWPSFYHKEDPNLEDAI